MIKVLGWICLVCWLTVAVGETVACITGNPIAVLELSWVDILIRDWVLVVFCVARLIDEYC